jgi:hypothetical protein
MLPFVFHRSHYWVKSFLTLLLNCILCYIHLCPALLPVNLDIKCQIITSLSSVHVHVRTVLHSMCGSTGVCQKYVTSQADTFHMDQTILFSDTGDMTHTSSCVSAKREWWTALPKSVLAQKLVLHRKCRTRKWFFCILCAVSNDVPCAQESACCSIDYRFTSLSIGLQDLIVHILTIFVYFK